VLGEGVAIFYDVILWTSPKGLSLERSLKNSSVYKINIQIFHEFFFEFRKKTNFSIFFVKEKIPTGVASYKITLETSSSCRQFYQRSISSFCACRSWKCKKCLCFRDLCVKAALRTLMKLTPEVNFSLWAAFVPKKLWQTLLCKKVSLKILVNLTPGLDFTNIYAQLFLSKKMINYFWQMALAKLQADLANTLVWQTH